MMNSNRLSIGMSWSTVMRSKRMKGRKRKRKRQRMGRMNRMRMVSRAITRSLISTEFSAPGKVHFRVRKLLATTTPLVLIATSSTVSSHITVLLPSTKRPSDSDQSNADTSTTQTSTRKWHA